MFTPEKLEALMDAFAREPELGLVAGQAVPIDESGKVIGKTFAKPLPENPRDLLLGNPLHVGSVLLRREWQEQAGLFDEQLRSYEDWDMWLRLGKLGCPMGFVQQPVSLYRFHGAQMTRDSKQMTTATFAVLEKVYADPELSADWRQLHNRAYSRAHLRAAAQAYHARDFDYGAECLDEATRLDLTLLEDEASKLAETFNAWIDLPKGKQRLEYLEDIYNHLPDSLKMLSEKKRVNLGKAAIQQAFEAYQRGDMQGARYAITRAFRYEPGYLLNRGAVAMFVRSSLQS